MIISQGRAAPPGRAPLLTGLAVAALSVAVAWLATGIMPADLLERPAMPEAERLALTTLACAVAALAILAGIAAFALERTLVEAPATPARPARPQGAAARPAAAFREAA